MHAISIAEPPNPHVSPPPFFSSSTIIMPQVCKSWGRGGPPNFRGASLQVHASLQEIFFRRHQDFCTNPVGPWVGPVVRRATRGPVVPDWPPPGRAPEGGSRADAGGSRVAAGSTGLLATDALLGLFLPSESAGQPGAPPAISRRPSICRTRLSATSHRPLAPMV